MLLYVEDRIQDTLLHMEHQAEQKLLIQCRSCLEQMCIYYGSTLKGRQKAASTFLHIRQKVPIVVHADLVLFPAYGSEGMQEVWINYCSIAHIEQRGNATLIIFYDCTQLLVDVPYRSILLQVRRCFHYLYSLDLHWNEQLMEQVIPEI